MLYQPVEALIGNNNARLFWVDSGIREVLRKSVAYQFRETRCTYGRVTKRAFGDGLEECRFTNIGEADLATTVNVRTRRRRKAGLSLTMPLFKLLPGRPSRTFSSLTCFLGGIFFFFADAYVRAVPKVMQSFRGKAVWRGEERKQTVLAAGREKVGINEEKEKVREVVGGVM